MRYSKNIFISSLLLMSSFSHASVAGFKKAYNKGAGLEEKIHELVDAGYPFAATPLMKEYLISTGANTARADNSLEEIATEVGLKQFEVLPDAVLQKSKAPSVQYILAKKLFRKGQYEEVIKLLNRAVPAKHPARPFAWNMIASSYALMQKTEEAKSAYDQCIESSNYAISKAKKTRKILQLDVNRDFCVAGLARLHFTSEKYDDAVFTYLDIQKSSPVWPSILFEEAWSSFYQKDYNRTLGKLVTYRAPLLQELFNPENDVLMALSYYELCLYDDAIKVIDRFNDLYQQDSDAVDGYMLKAGKNYEHFVKLIETYSAGKRTTNPLMNSYLGLISRESVLKEMLAAYLIGQDELERAKEFGSPAITKYVNTLSREALNYSAKLVGAYSRKRVLMLQDELKKSFQGLSYIKLEILGKKKERIYFPELASGEKRGDVSNLKRNEKQYFWNFGGEFWADELGDYVFSLKSECSK